MPQIQNRLRKGVKGVIMPVTLILSVSGYSSALETRNMVLQAAGYTVVPAQSIEEALDQFLTGDFDLVLLDYDFPPSDREYLTSSIRATGSHIPIVSVAPDCCGDDPFVDKVVASDPEMLLEGMREVLLDSENASGVNNYFRR